VGKQQKFAFGKQLLYSDAVDALKKAIDLLQGQAALAAALGLKQQHVWNWLERGKGKVPAEHCPAIERVTGGKVRCEDLRPDVPWDVLREPPKRKKSDRAAADDQSVRNLRAAIRNDHPR
jgi:DNA-binding transcriptional regulator YdaS (Cro superfamily)